MGKRLLFARIILKISPNDLIEYPEIDICGDYRRQGKGDTDADKISGFNFVTVFAQDADTGNVGGSSDRGTVAAQGGTGQKAEVQECRRDT